MMGFRVRSVWVTVSLLIVFALAVVPDGAMAGGLVGKASFQGYVSYNDAG
jgi:multisubunit Na+/H+ antiporter MnhB subunit